MKKLFLVSVLALSMFVSGIEVPANAQASGSGSVRKTTAVSATKGQTKPKTKTGAKTQVKSKTKAKPKAKVKAKPKAKSKSPAKSKTKQTSTKSGSKTANKSKTVSRSSSETFDASRILSLALSLKGTPYKYGGQSPKGFDCSGFTGYVFKNAAGISLPRTSGGQASAGIHIAKAELQPGDLVYFNTNGSGISHVGIYTGGGKFIHASRTKGITVTSLDDSYYKPRYLGAARVR